MPHTALPIALQLYTIRDALNTNLESALAEAAEIGYSNVELAGLHDRSPETFKRLLDQHGLKAISSHIGVADLDDLEAAADRARLFGYTHLGLAFIDPSWRTPDRYRELARKLHDAGRRLRDQGLTLFYHNHAFEFDRLDTGERGYDILFAPGSTPGDDPGFTAELDVYWVQKGGDDPLDWLQKLSGRVPLLHIKDMEKTPDQGFAEVGTGTVPIQQIVAAAPDHGVRHLVIEQDSNWIDDQPLKSARISFENLRAMVG